MNKWVIFGIAVFIAVLVTGGLFYNSVRIIKNTQTVDYWKDDGINLMRHSIDGTYGCFGCSGPEAKTPMCVDPISEMKIVEETESRYCDSDFKIVENVSAGDDDSVSLEVPAPGFENVPEMIVNEEANCPDILDFETPVDLNKVYSILYPGQVRGGDFKPHGGFRFDGYGNDISVLAPYDSRLSSGARYLQDGKLQYMFDFETDCNVRFRFDHLYTLSPKLQALVDDLPEAKEGDSHTTQLEGIEFSKGEEIATSVGVAGNSFVDFGVYDYRKENEASKTSELVQNYPSELASHAVCWFDWLSEEDAAKVRSLPAGDQNSGSNSEYC